MTKTEPLITAATITAAAAAVLALLTAFSVPLTDDQRQAILSLVAILAPLAVGIAARGKVTPNTTVVEHVENGYVVAGEASEGLPAGTPVRRAGEWPASPEVRTVDLTPPGTGADGVDDTPRRQMGE